MTIAVQGFGNVGYHTAKFLSEEDKAKVVCIIERDGYIWNASGLDVEEVKRHQLATGSILGFERASSHSGSEEGLFVKCDILIPAAMEAAITQTNSSMIKAALIVEAANGPVTSDAEPVLKGLGVAILPDLFVNAGGVIVSYFEWLRT